MLSGDQKIQNKRLQAKKAQAASDARDQKLLGALKGQGGGNNAMTGGQGVTPKP